MFTRGGAAATDALQMAAPKRIVYSVRDKCRTLIDELRERGSMSLNTLYSQCASRSEIVATFIAVLELCREKVIHLAGSDTDCTVECGDDAPDRINL